MGLKMVMYGSLRDSVGVGVGASLYESYNAYDGQTVFNLAGSYRIGVGELEVYRNGIYQTVNIDYLEDAANVVRFREPLELNELVTFKVEEVRNQSFFQTITAFAGQRTFQLSGSYRVGQNSLQVYDNGILKTLYDDYVEIDSNTIELTYDAVANSKFTFRDSL